MCGFNSKSVFFKNEKVILKKERENFQQSKYKFFVNIEIKHLRSKVVLHFWIELDLEECLILLMI